LCNVLQLELARRRGLQSGGSGYRGNVKLRTGAQPYRGTDFEEPAAPLERCPDTNPEFFDNRCFPQNISWLWFYWLPAADFRSLRIKTKSNRKPRPAASGTMPTAAAFQASGSARAISAIIAM